MNRLGEFSDRDVLLHLRIDEEPTIGRVDAKVEDRLMNHPLARVDVFETQAPSQLEDAPLGDAWPHADSSHHDLSQSVVHCGERDFDPPLCMIDRRLVAVDLHGLDARVPGDLEPRPERHGGHEALEFGDEDLRDVVRARHEVEEPAPRLRQGLEEIPIELEAETDGREVDAEFVELPGGLGDLFGIGNPAICDPVGQEDDTMTVALAPDFFSSS